MTLQSSPAALLAPRIIRAGAACHYSYLGPGITGSCLIDAQATSGAYSAFDINVAPGAGVPPHVHTIEDETFYLLEGTCALQCGDKLYTLTAGMSAHAPRNIPHAFFNVGKTDARLMVVTTPGGFEDFFAEFEAGEATYGDLGTTQAQMQLGALMGKYGMTPAFDAPTPTPSEVPAPALVDMGNHVLRLLASSEQTDGQLLMAHTTAYPQGGPPPHVHRAEDEAFYMLSGRMEMVVGDAVTEIGPGDFVFGPRHTPHCWLNIGEADATFVLLVTPAPNFEEFAYEMAQFIRETNGTPLAEMREPALLQRMGQMFQNHLIEPAAPGPIK